MENSKLRIILIVIIASFLAVMLVVFYLYKDLYRKNLELRLSPINENKDLKGKEGAFWLIGDSRIAQWDFNENINLKSCEINNLGIEGQTSQQVYFRLKNNLEKAKPKYVFIQVGINDLKIIGLNRKIKDSIVNNTSKSIISILEVCKNNQVIPIYSTIFPVGNIPLIRKLVWNDEISKAIYDTNNNIINFCLKNNILVFDSYLLLKTESDKLNSKFSKDELHLNKKGYKYLTTNLINLINKNK